MHLKKICLLFSLFLWSVFSWAETYTTNFSAPSNTPGRAWSYGFVIDFIQNEGGVVSGEITRFYGADRCRWPGTKLNGHVKGNGDVQWQTEQNPLQGCGTIRFVGKKEDGKLVGYLPRFQGVKVDLELLLDK